MIPLTIVGQTPLGPYRHITLDWPDGHPAPPPGQPLRPDAPPPLRPRPPAFPGQGRAPAPERR
ncbi:MAG TPA: hypothetical protein ENO16_07155, partial [Chromatiales bacterium]|nr:hypothetical protein [Chromatiales bacterium]